MHRPLLSLAVLGCLGLPMSAAGQGPRGSEAATPVLFEDFESPRTTGLYAALVQHPLLDIAAGKGVGGGTALRATYAGFEEGSRRIVVAYPLPKPGDEFTLNYDVLFEDGFQFTRGGKLHGLGPTRPLSGGDPVRPDGWSARVVFRPQGEVQTYSYHQDMQGKFGEGGVRLQPFRFEIGRYYAVSLQVRVNTPAASSNGFVRLYLDGRLVEERENLRFRSQDGDSTRISRFLFSTFHGGSTPAFAPRNAAGGFTTVYACFDNIAVYPGRRIRSKPGG